MKSILYFTVCLFSLFFLKASAQEKKPLPAAPSDFHAHRGFHFEFGLGPAFGKINDKFTYLGGNYDWDYKGTGAAIQISLGGSIDENLMLTFDILSKAVTSPEVDVKNGRVYPTSNNLSIGEVTYGGGLTYFAMPTDIFVGATLGAGTFVITNNNPGSNQTLRSKYGLSMQMRGGKHWWISNTWGIFLGATYGFTSVDNTQYNQPEHLVSGRFTIMAIIGLH